MGLFVPMACGIFQTRDRIGVLCIGRQILNLWTAREVQDPSGVFTSAVLFSKKPAPPFRKHFHQSAPFLVFGGPSTGGASTEVYREGMWIFRCYRVGFQMLPRHKPPIISIWKGCEDTWSTQLRSPSRTYPRVTSSIDYFNDSITSNCVSPICSSPITDAETQRVSPFWQ